MPSFSPFREILWILHRRSDVLLIQRNKNIRPIHTQFFFCVYVFCTDILIVSKTIKLMSYFWSTNLQTNNCRYRTRNTISCVVVFFFLTTCKEVMGDWAQTPFTLVKTKKYKQITDVRQNTLGANESELLLCVFYSTLHYSVEEWKISVQGKHERLKKWSISHFSAPS